MDCDALAGEAFDVGWYMFHAIGKFLSSGAQEYPLGETCNVKTDCNDLPPTPPERDNPGGG